MAYGDMGYAVSGSIASAAEYNKHVDHIEDLDTRLDTAESTITSNGTRLTTVENRVGAAPSSPNVHSRLTALEAVSGTGTPTVISSPGSRGSVTSTTYVESRTITVGTGEAAAVFTAPASGKVKISWAASIQAPTTTGFALATYIVRNGGTIGSGAVVTGAEASDTRTLQNTGASAGEQSLSNFEILEGLTPGNQYNIRMAYRTSTGTSWFNRPKVLVEPVLN